MVNGNYMNIDETDGADSPTCKWGTSLDPPLYDCRQLFSMFAPDGNKHLTKRVVDMDQIWNDANARLSNGDGPSVDNIKKLQKFKSHDRSYQNRLRKAQAKDCLQEERPKMKNTQISTKQGTGNTGTPMPHNNSMRPSQVTQMKESYRQRAKTQRSNSCPLSYHGFLAKEMKRASFDERSPERTISPPMDASEYNTSISVLKELYQIR